MSATAVFSIVYLVSAMLLLLVGPFRAGTTEIPPIACVIGSMFLLSLIAMIWNPRIQGVHRTILLFFFFGLYITMFYPFILLSTWPEIYELSGLTRALVFGIPPIGHIRVLIYTGFSAVCFFLGMLLVCHNRRPLHHIFLEDRPSVYNNRTLLLAIALLGIVFQIVVDTMFGAQTVDERGKFGMLMRLVPAVFYLVMVMLLLIKYNKKLSAPNIIACLVFVLGFSLVGVLAGRRGMILAVPFYTLMSVLLIHPNFRLGSKIATALVVFAVTLVPAFLAVTTVTKNVAKDNDYGERKFSVAEVSDILEADIHLRYFAWFSGRFQGYQAGVVLDGKGGDELLRIYAKPTDIAASVVEILLPDRLLPEAILESISLGKAAGLVLGGATYEQSHASSWFGIPFLKGYFGWYGLILLVLLGIFLGFLPYWMLGRDEIITILFISIVYNMTWNLNISGNIDILFAEWVQAAVVFVMIAFGLSFFSAKQAQPRMGIRAKFRRDI